MKTILNYLASVIRNLFPMLFRSRLWEGYKLYSASVPAMAGLPIAFKAHPPFRPPLRTNGASRKKRSNRLRISKMTRNKHR